MSSEKNTTTDSENDLRGDEVKLNVAKNIAAARNAMDISQDVLAEKAHIGRATLIQIETGKADPRLSTLIKIATALEVNPSMLLMGKVEFEAIASFSMSELECTLQKFDPNMVELTRHLVDSGMDRNRNRAAKIGGEMSSAVGMASGAISGAAIGTILLPGLGTVIGAALGSLFGKKLTKR